MERRDGGLHFHPCRTQGVCVLGGLQPQWPLPCQWLIRQVASGVVGRGAPIEFVHAILNLKLNKCSGHYLCASMCGFVSRCLSASTCFLWERWKRRRKRENRKSRMNGEKRGREEERLLMPIVLLLICNTRKTCAYMRKLSAHSDCPCAKLGIRPRT